MDRHCARMEAPAKIFTEAIGAFVKKASEVGRLSRLELE